MRAFTVWCVVAAALVLAVTLHLTLRIDTLYRPGWWP